MNRQFPPEIVQLIVEASLNPYDLFATPIGDIKARYSILKGFARVNSTWCGASQVPLFRLVVLRTEASVRKFSELAKSKGTIGGVNDLSISCRWARNSSSSLSTLTTLLGYTPNVISLSCSGGWILMDNLARLRRLRRAELSEVQIKDSPSSTTLCLPQLRQLRLARSPYLSALPYLTPSFLPQLRYLEIDWSIVAPDTIEPLVEQLHGLKCNSDEFPSLPSFAKSLQLLSLRPDRESRLATLTSLPILPPFLSINFYEDYIYDWHDETIDALEDVLANIKTGFRVLLLHDLREDKWTVPLVEQLEERGIRVDWHPQDDDYPFCADIVRMEEILAKEKRAAERAERRRKRRDAGEASDGSESPTSSENWI